MNGEYLTHVNMLIDTHCHLQDFSKKKLKAIISRARDKGIRKIIVAGYDKTSNIKAIELATQYRCVYATVGYGPSTANDIKNLDWSLLEKMISHKKVVAIGEIGLDYYWNKDNKPQQRKLFRRQISLAIKYNKPIVIHNREATQDVYNLIKEEGKMLLKGMMHCFNFDAKSALSFIKLGMLISIGGLITFKNTTLISVIKEIPLEYIVLETDTPYLTPEPYRGEVNEPGYLFLIANEIAKTKGVSYEEVARQTTRNASYLFDLEAEI